ncbi:MAG: HAMP domain-containing histidine kinase [Simkaniaceae bacterium]|nr:HAMP domain-containing histidine kinase [Simkaniaceae bacterium]
MKIFPKLLLWFLFLTLFPLLVFFAITYNNFFDVVFDEEIKNLKRVAHARISFLDDFFDEMRSDISLTAKVPSITHLLKDLESLKTQEDLFRYQYKGEALSAKNFIDEFRSKHGFENVVLISREGKVLFESFQTENFGKNITDRQESSSFLFTAFENTMNLLETTVTSFGFKRFKEESFLYISSPIIDPSTNQLIGLILVQLTSAEIFRIFAQYTPINNSGEIVLSKKDGDDTVYFVINPREINRGLQLFTLKKNAPYAWPMQEAVVGISGEGQSIDYKNIKIIAAWNYFPVMQMGIVFKLDYDEVFRPIAYYRYVMLIVGGLAIAIVILAVILIAKSIVRPLRDLERGVQIIGKGNLNFEMKNNSKDEIGNLTRAFDELRANLCTSMQTTRHEIHERRQAEQLKAEFISVISHEFLTPIMPIKESVLQVAKGDMGPVNDTQKKLLEIAYNNTNRLQNLINDVLDFQKLEAGKEEYDFLENDLNKLIKEVCSFLKISEKEHKVELIFQFDESLPKVECDVDKIKQVVKNLLDNAIKYTDNGNITITTKRVEDAVEVSIVDTGIGISEQDQANLFQSFRFLRTKKESKREGTGLGLVIAQLIIDNHGGSIGVESTLGEGTKAHFTLPISQIHNHS